MKQPAACSGFFLRLIKSVVEKVLFLCQRLTMQPKLLLNAQQIDILLHRLACQLIEHHGDFSNCVLIGLQPRGRVFARSSRQFITRKI